MSYYFSLLLTEKAKHSKTFLIIKSSTFKGLIRQEDIVVIGQFCAYCILSIKHHWRLLKNWWFWPSLFSSRAFNQGLAFINEMQFSVTFSGWFIITDPQRPRSSLSGGMILPFVLPQELQGWQLYVHYS